MPATLASPPPAKRRSGPGRLAGFLGGQIASHAARRLDQPGRDPGAQAQVYRQLMANLAETAFGREVGLEPGLSHEAFRRRVAPRAYEDLVSFIERMKRGEPDVLCPGRCGHFAVSSGTTAGASKWLPVNEAMVEHFRAAGLDSLFLYARRVGSGSVFRGRHLFLGGSSALVALPDIKPPIYWGDLSGIAALNLPHWVERLLYEPGTDIAQMTDWPEKIEAIARRTANADITLVAGIPSWLLVLANAVLRQARAEGRPEASTLQAIWPGLECLVHGGVPVGPFANELRAVYGESINFHEVYPASEGFIAVQDADSAAGLRLLTDRGLFFEFLPLADYQAGKLDRAVTVEGAQRDVDYVLLLTTPAGLVRYVIGDVVRFVSVAPPRIIYAGRTKLQLSAFGEHVIERELTDALTEVCGVQGFTPVNFHVAPLFPQPGSTIGRHEWWIELRAQPGQSARDPLAMAEALDRALARRNDDYAAKRSGQGLLPPLVQLVRPGLFEDWLRGVGKWGGQSKTPRCRSDRLVADELTRLV